MPSARIGSTCVKARHQYSRPMEPADTNSSRECKLTSGTSWRKRARTDSGSPLVLPSLMANKRNLRRLHVPPAIRPPRRRQRVRRLRPGHTFCKFPRQLGKDEDAVPLVEALWRVLEKAAVIPDMTGKLRAGVELWRHPRDSAQLARDWQALASFENASRFIHPSCLERYRNSRLNTLAERLVNAEDASSSPKLRT
jgi:hypothetical protein